MYVRDRMRPLSWLVAGAAVLGGVAGDALALQQTELKYEVPPGYAEQRSGDIIILAPTTVGDGTPCVYGLATPRPASGNLEADAEAALEQAVVPGWRRLDDRHAAMRGTAADGWPWVWYRAAFEGDINGQRQAVNAMAMAGGRFKLQGGELVLTPSHRPQSPDRYRVRAYEEWFLGGWKPAIALLNGAASPPLVVPYYRVDEP
jgi:hypothetical protein